MLAEVLSFVLAATWVSMSTVVTERLGTKVGAMVTTLPSTIIVALFFIAVDEGPDLAAEVAAVVPAEMTINVVFLAVFIAVSRRGLPMALTAALGIWTVLSTALFLLDPDSLVLSMAVFIAGVACATVWLRARHSYEQRPGRHIAYTPGEIAFRGLFAGSMIALSVVAARLSGPMLGGILSVFPAIFTSTMVILYLRQGREFSGATGSLMIVGSANVVVYSLVAVFAFPVIDAYWGTAIAFGLSYLWSLGLYLAVKRFIE
jgi:hypothetical protein